MSIGELEKKKRKRENGPLPWALVWAIVLGLGLDQQMEVESGPSWVGIGHRLKEMGLGGAMGRMGSDCLQLRFRTPFDVLAFIFFTNI